MASDASSSQFYVLQPRRGSSADTEFFKAEPITRGEAPKCPTCGRFLGMRTWLPPRRAQIVFHGERAGDFAFVSSSEFVVSERVVAAVEESDLSGLNHFDQVEIVSTLGAATVAAPRYFHADMAQQAADLDPEASEIERTAPPACVDCLSDGISAIRGFVVDPATWRGTDVFVPRGLPGVVVVTEKFRKVAKAHDFSNLKLVPTERFTWVPSVTT